MVSPQLNKWVADFDQLPSMLDNLEHLLLLGVALGIAPLE